YNLHEVDGFVNLPLSDRAALRIAAQHTDRDGYIKNISTGQDDENENETAVRLSLRLRPTNDFENVTVANYITRHTNGTGFRFSALNPQSAMAAIYGPAAVSTLAASQSLPWNE